MYKELTHQTVFNVSPTYVYINQSGRVTRETKIKHLNLQKSNPYVRSNVSEGERTIIMDAIDGLPYTQTLRTEFWNKGVPVLGISGLLHQEVP